MGDILCYIRYCKNKNKCKWLYNLNYELPLITMQNIYRSYDSAFAKCPKGSYVTKSDSGKGFVIRRFPKTPKETWPPSILDSWKKQH